MTHLIYILASGRSGSTVVERVLNTGPDLVGVGEVHALWRLPHDSLTCACGGRMTHCPFWREVLSHAAIGSDELRYLSHLEHEVVRNRYLARLRYDLEAIAEDARLKDFAMLQGQLFAGIRAVAQVNTVVDSSKAGPRAWVLAATLKPSILHVYRGAEEVIASWRKPKFDPGTQEPMKKPPIHVAALDWMKAEQAARSLSKVTSVRRLDYRQFAEHPQTALQNALGQDLRGGVRSLAWTGPRNVRPDASYHSVLGNPDRFDQSEIQIAPRRASDRARFGYGERKVIGTVGKTLEWVYP